MTPENETQLVQKVNDIHTYLVGDPLHDKKGMITEHKELQLEVKNVRMDVSNIKSWVNNVKIRVAMVSGGVVVLFETGKKGIDWLTGK